MAFELRWDAMHEWSGKAFTPSIKVIDEAQDLGLGATYPNLFELVNTYSP